MSRFTGRGALVTGAASGIGRALAASLHAEGAHVVLVDRDPHVHEVRRLIGTEPAPGAGTISAVCADLSSAADVARAVQSAVDTPAGLHIVVHAAASSASGTVLTMTETQWRTVLDNDLTSAFHVARATIPHLIETGGNLLLIASQLGLVGTRASVAYTAAKGGLVNLTRSLALDHAGDGVRVNCLCPGPTLTPFLERSFQRTGSPESARQAALDKVPLGRFGTAQEVANAAAFLCSDEASFITGTTLVVDGGYLAQ